MTPPKGTWTPFFVLIICSDRFGFHRDYMVIKAMCYGWCTGHYWLDYPRSEQIREAVETHPDFDLDKTRIVKCGDCLYCEGKAQLRITSLQ